MGWGGGAEWAPAGAAVMGPACLLPSLQGQLERDTAAQGSPGRRRAMHKAQQPLQRPCWRLRLLAGAGRGSMDVGLEQNLVDQAR